MPMSPRILRPIAAKSAASVYASLRTGLVAYYPFEENAATGDVTALDWTNRGNDLTSYNTVPSVTGKVGSGRQFTLDNLEYLAGADSADLTFTSNAWSMAFWFFIPTSAPAEDRMQLMAKDSESYREFAFEYNQSNITDRLDFNFYGADLFPISSISVSGVPRNQWNFVCLRHGLDAPTISAHFNTTTYTSSERDDFPSGTTPFTVGRRDYVDFEEYSTFSIDELAVWSRVLSVAEVETLYNSGAGIDLRQ